MSPVRRKRPRVNMYAVISRAVEEGVGWGLQRAHKYEELPDRESLQQHLEENVMNALCEVLQFNDEEN